VVRVGGAVNAQTAVAYVPGKDLPYYVAAAGGLSRTADGGRAYVTQPNGKVETVKKRFSFLADSWPDPLAGASVIVPEKVEGPKKDTLTILATVASIVTSMATVLIVAIR
jgi:hypothetical protein